MPYPSTGNRFRPWAAPSSGLRLPSSFCNGTTKRSAPFQRIYNQLIREDEPGWLAGWRLLFRRMRRGTKRTADWTNLLALVQKDEQDDIRQLLVVSRQRKELLIRLIYQQRYKNVLESWLYIHIPFTILLLVFAIVHVAAAFYYGRIAW